MPEVKPEKESNVKTFYFTKEEKDFLTARQFVLEQSKIILQSVEALIQNFIIVNTIPRLGLKPDKENIEYDITAGTLKVSPKIVLPGKEDEKIV